MSERGVFAVDRGIWDHPIFADEPLTEREAWQWLISEAAFRSRKKRVGDTVFDLRRGQLVASIRFMGEAWQWDKSKVSRFLKKLKSEAMIETQARHDATVITVCKYDVYQRVSLPSIEQSETPNETRTRHERDKLEDTKNIEGIGDGGGTARAKLVSDEAQDTADAMAAACGFPDPKACPFGWYGAAIWVQKCLNEGWSPSLMIEGSRATAAKKRDGPIESYRYLEKPLARFIAEHSRPLPQVEIREAEKVVSYGPGKRHSNSGGSIIAELDRRLAALQEEDGIDPEVPEGAVLRLSGGPVR